MKEFIILKFLDKVSFIFKFFGINYLTMRKILQVKLTMDQRRVPTIMMEKNKSESKSSFTTSLIMYAIIGVFIGIFMFVPFSLFFKMNIIIGMIIFMIMSTMISDFSSVLLDVDDKIILLPRPIDAKTLNAAKLIHIIFYLFSITVAIAGASLVFGLIKYGVLFFFLFLFEIILICGFVILFTALFYYAVITFFNGEKLKDIINYFQIVLTTFIVIIYQFIGRIFEISNLNINFTPHLWNFLLPSSWFAAPFTLLIDNDFNNYFIVLSLVGFIVPIITMILYVKIVAPRFERNLQKLNNSSNSNKNKVKKELIQRKISNIICYNSLEKIFFRFTLQMLNNERKLKLRLYPNLVFSVIFPFIIFFNFFRTQESFSDVLAQITNGKYYLYLYLSVAFLSSLFSLTSLSENYKGSWIYKAMPVDNPAMVLKGAFKSFLTKYVAPIYLFIGLIYVVIFGLKILPDLALIFINLLVLMLVIFAFSKKELPFYKDFQYTQNGNNIGILLLTFALCGGLAAIHYILLSFVPFGVMLNLAISLMTVIILWHNCFKISWKDIANDAQ